MQDIFVIRWFSHKNSIDKVLSHKLSLKSDGNLFMESLYMEFLLSELPDVEFPLAGGVAVGDELHGQTDLSLGQVGTLSHRPPPESADELLQSAWRDFCKVRRVQLIINKK